MTTVAWDGKTMAADRQMTIGPIRMESVHPKIKRITYHGQPAIVGRAGTMVLGLAVVDWLEKGCPVDERPDIGDGDNDNFTVMVAGENGVYLYVDSLLPIPLGYTKWALGTGAEFALGAMDAGASAKRAVELTCARDINSGSGVDVLPLGGKR